jgi:hypothetical protein
MSAERRKKGSGPETGQAKVDIKAAAELSATAKYEVRKSIQEVIPEDVTRAKAGAWLTLISPITEWAGLKGDELAHKRALLRLQREEALAEIANRVQTRLSTFSPRSRVPAKFLVPFLEKASLEEPNSELVDLWANLLVSAAEEYNPHYVHFASIISQMSARQAQIFTDVIGTNDASALEISMSNLFTEYLHNFMEEYLSDQLKAASQTPKVLDDMWRLLEKDLNHIGIEIQHLHLEDLINDDFTNGTIGISKYEDDLETDFAILDATRLIRYVDTGFFVLAERWRIKVMFYYVTTLGRDFAKACGIIK